MTQYAHVKSGSVNLITTYLNGWGNDNKGNWHKGHYTLHIMSMGSILAVVPFEIGEVNLDGDPEIFYPANGTATTGIVGKEKSNVQSNEVSLEESLKELAQLIGLNNIKTEIHNQINYLNFLKLRREKGFEDQSQINLHAVFTGNPGTGKTTVVNQLGKIYKAMGLLSKGHVVEVDRADLVAEYIGQTAPKVKKQIEAARGGILFIDEAYALSRQGDDNKDYGKEVIEILLKEMSDGPGDIAIMVAGYPREMNVFLNSNPGLRSRFGQYYHFEDYLPEELMQIALLTAHRKKLNLTDDAKAYLEKKLTDAYRSRDESFGNARFATSLIHEAKQNLAIRIMKHTSPQTLSEEEISTISLEDIEKIFLDEIHKKLDLEIDDELLRSALDELNRLIGLHNIKQEVQEYVKLVKYYREVGKDVLNQFSLHTVFTGNPGTGKTTVARIMAKIYKALGLLERGHLIEADRQSLVAGYVGQTANKTKQLIESAMGGVLFIDEAYALANKGNDDFGHEAIEILLKAMEDHRGKFAVIVAGYTDDMQEFLESNPGLKSRFDEIFEFSDYTVDELYAIAFRMLLTENISPNEEADTYLKNYLQFLFEHRDKYFGNAREVRKIIEKAVRNQHIRLASITREERTPEMIKTLTLQDLEEFKMIKPVGDKTKIGFRKP
jgi:SpoVK/Ycf46/Vps4 family AAA+-type ATPase